ncbi:MAG TPA: alpha/beta hydrolase [Ktedonobacteraceae bacterium]|nr:alpha/beta hydrolase [Ktedonobacteraceae bacterium]
MSDTEELAGRDFEQRVTHGYANNNGVKLHYATLGEGPLVVFIHGFPDFWYTWRYQMVALAPYFQTVAFDTRGYNLSDKPEPGENYTLPHLISDVEAIIRHFGREKAVIVGHDWGGAISWEFAMSKPELTDKLIILNSIHTRNLRRELTHSPEQREHSQYARNFLQEGSYRNLTAERLAAWVTDPEVKARYIEAFERSSFPALMSYYQQNFPREPYTEDERPVVKIKAPGLILYGLNDNFLLPAGQNNIWELFEQEVTLVTLPGAGHFVQQDARDRVSHKMLTWLRD